MNLSEDQNSILDNKWWLIRSRINNLSLNESKSSIPLLINGNPWSVIDPKTIISFNPKVEDGKRAISYDSLYSTTNYSADKMAARPEYRKFASMVGIKGMDASNPPLSVKGTHFIREVDLHGMGDFRSQARYIEAFEQYGNAFGGEEGSMVRIERDKAYDAINVVTFDFFLAENYPEVLARVISDEPSDIDKNAERVRELLMQYKVDACIKNSAYYIAHLPKMSYNYSHSVVAKKLEHLIPLAVLTNGRENLLYDRLLATEFKLYPNRVVSQENFDDFRKTFKVIDAPVAHHVRGRTGTEESNKIIYSTLYDFCVMANVRVIRYNIVKGGFILKYLLCPELYNYVLYGSPEWHTALQREKIIWDVSNLNIGQI